MPKKQREVYLHVIPPPDGEFGKDQALEWLETQAPWYLMVMENALLTPDKEARSATIWLKMDVSEMVQACAAVIRGEPVVIECVNPTCESALQIPLILTTEEHGEFEAGGAYSQIARNLAVRLRGCELIDAGEDE